MDKKLLDILCCPIGRHTLLPLPSERLAALNAGIRQSRIRQQDGKIPEQPVRDALLSADGKWIYRIDDGIPVLLADEAIAAAQLDQTAA